jgi:hypothetical protein
MNRTTLLTEFQDNDTGLITASDCRDVINNVVMPQDLQAGTGVTLNKTALPTITISSSGVPYTGATQGVDLNTQSFNAGGAIFRSGLAAASFGLNAVETGPGEYVYYFTVDASGNITSLGNLSAVGGTVNFLNLPSSTVCSATITLSLQRQLEFPLKKLRRVPPLLRS